MEETGINVTNEELRDFMKPLEGIKSTIEILQDKVLMDEIKESEENIRLGKVRKLEI